MKKLVLLFVLGTAFLLPAQINNGGGGASTNPTSGVEPVKSGSVFIDSPESVSGGNVTNTGTYTANAFICAGGLGCVNTSSNAAALAAPTGLFHSFYSVDGPGFEDFDSNNCPRGFGLPSRTVSGTSGTGIVACDAEHLVIYTNSGAITDTIPDASAIASSGFFTGRRFYLFNAGTGTLTLSRTTASTINGQTTLIVYPGNLAPLVSDGTNWQAPGVDPSQVVAGSVVKTLGTTAGGIVATQGSANGHATANTVTIEAPAAVTAYEDVWPGTSASGFLYGTNSSAVRTESFGELSGDVTTSGSLATTVSKVNGIGIQRVTMVADWTCGTGGTVSSCVAATIVGSTGTPLTITLPSVSASYHWQCEGVVGQATAATANSWNFLTATNGATNVTASYQMNTAATAMTGGAVTDQASTTSTVVIGTTWTLGGTATKMPFHVSGSIEGASASGTVLSLQLVAPTVGDLVTIYRGATCSVGPF